LIRPCPGPLSTAKGKVPTPRGPIGIEWQRGESFNLRLALPEGMRARVELPASGDASEVVCDGKAVAATRHGGHWRLDEPVSGEVELELR
jgi:hypothetical protein